jgi:predicted kinase
VTNARVLHALRLRRSNLLKLLSDTELEFLAVVSETLVERRGRVLARQGAEGDALYVVVRGQLKVPAPADCCPSEAAWFLQFLISDSDLSF